MHKLEIREQQEYDNGTALGIEHGARLDDAADDRENKTSRSDSAAGTYSNDHRTCLGQGPDQRQGRASSGQYDVPCEGTRAGA